MSGPFEFITEIWTNNIVISEAEFLPFWKRRFSSEIRVKKISGGKSWPGLSFPFRMNNLKVAPQWSEWSLNEAQMQKLALDTFSKEENKPGTDSSEI